MQWNAVVMTRVVTYLFRVLEVLEESLLGPSDTLVHVGGGVGEALCLTSLTTEDTVHHEEQQTLSMSFDCEE